MVIPPKRRSPKSAHIRSCTGAKNKSFEKGAQIDLKHITIDRKIVGRVVTRLISWLSPLNGDPRNRRILDRAREQKNKRFEKGAQIDLKHINIDKELLVGWLLGSSHSYPS